MEYLTVEQVAERLQVSAWTVRRWLRDGDLEGSHLSDRAGWRVPEGAIERFLQARSNRAGDEVVESGETGKAAA
jgi:excisionase family DNA binding protein